MREGSNISLLSFPQLLVSIDGALDDVKAEAVGVAEFSVHHELTVFTCLSMEKMNVQ